MTPVSAGNLQLSIGTVYAGTMTAGSAALSTGSAAFTSADVGRRISVIGAGPNTGDPFTGSLLVSHIASYTDSTHVTLADAASTSCGGGDSNTTVYRAVGASVANAMSFNPTLTARDTFAFTYISLDGSTVMLAGSPVLLTDTVLGVDYFGGTIDQVQATDTPGSTILESQCDCVGWDYLLSKRLATPYRGTYTAMTLADIALDLINYQAGSEGITVSSVTGPTLTIEPFDFSTVYEALDKLCQAANDATHTYIWYIDAWKVVHIIEQTAVAAPWNIDDRDGSDANALDREGEGIQVTWSREKLANRVYNKASRTLSPDAVNDAQQGNGSTHDFTTKANIEQLISIDVDGVAKTAGIAGIDTGKDFYWTPGSNAFSQDAGASAVASGHWIHLSYYTSSATVAFAQNSPGVDSAAQVEGGTGFWDTSTSIDTLVSEATATALAQSQADAYGMIPVAVNVSTYRAGLKPGQLITIHLSNLHVDGAFLIDSVTLDCTDNLQLWTVHAVNGALIGDYRTALITLAGGGTLTAGGMLPPPYAGPIVPSPWQPGYESPITGDPLFSAAGFGIAPAYDLASDGSPLATLNTYGTPPAETDVAIVFKVRRELVSGRFAQVAANVTTVDATHGTIAFGGSGGIAGQFIGAIISKIANGIAGVGTLLAIQDFTVTANDTSGNFTVTPDPFAAGCAAGDLFTLRTAPTAADATSFTDGLFNNLYNSGLTPNGNRGNLALVIGGHGAGQPPQLVTTNTATKVTVSPGWSVVPDATSVLTLVEAVPQVVLSADMAALASGTLRANLPINNYARMVVRVEGYATRGEAAGPIETVPFREIYIWGAQGTRVITT